MFVYSCSVLLRDLNVRIRFDTVAEIASEKGNVPDELIRRAAVEDPIGYLAFLKETKSERLATFLPYILKEHNIKGFDGDVATLRRIIASPGWNDGGDTTSNFESTIRRFDMRQDARTQGDLLLRGITRAATFKRWIQKLAVLFEKRHFGYVTPGGYREIQPRFEQYGVQRQLAYKLAWANELLKGTNTPKEEPATIGEQEAMQTLEDEFVVMEHLIEKKGREGHDYQRSNPQERLAYKKGLFRKLLVEQIEKYGMKRIEEIYRQTEARYDYRWRLKDVGDELSVQECIKC